jgi:O-antigen ligase
MTERLDSPVPLAAAGLAFAAVLLGLLAGIDPRLAIGAALGGAFVVLVLQDVTLGFCFMAFLASLDALPALGALSVAKVAGVLLGVSWIAAVATQRREQLWDRHPLLVYALLLFLAWNMVSISWAESQTEVFEAIIRYAPNLLLVPIAFTALRTERDFRWVLWAVIVAALISAVLGAIGPAQEASALGDDRAQGLAGGANELAAALVVGLTLVLSVLTMRATQPITRLALGFGAFLCVLSLFLSLSRGGLLAAGAALLTAVIVGGRWRGKALGVALGLVAVAFMYFAFFASLPARERVTEVAGGTGRTDLWTVGWRMVEDQPIRGVGAGNFPIASIHYLLEPGALGTDEFIVSRPKVAHNTILEILGETGAIGLSLFLAILGTSLFCMLRAARSFERQGARDLEILARGLIVALVGYMVAGSFISANYSKLLWLLIALGPPLLALAQRRESSSV